MAYSDYIYDVVVAPTKKAGLHAMVDWELSDGEYSQVIIVSTSEALEGLDPSIMRLHFAEKPNDYFMAALNGLVESRGFKLDNITIHRWSEIDEDQIKAGVRTPQEV